MSEHDCDEVIAILHAYLDGELDAAQLAEVEGHLGHCSPCLEAFDFEAELKRVVRTKCAEQMPVDLRVRLLALVRGSTPPPE